MMRALHVSLEKDPISKCGENTINYAAGGHKKLPIGVIRAGIY